MRPVASYEGRKLDRQRVDAAGIQRDIFGRGAEGAPPLAIADKNTGAEKRRVTAGADSLDDAGPVTMRYYPVKPHRTRPGPGLDIGRVDPGRMQADQNFTRTRRGIRHVTRHQHRIRGAV